MIFSHVCWRAPVSVRRVATVSLSLPTVNSDSCQLGLYAGASPAYQSQNPKTTANSCLEHIFWSRYVRFKQSSKLTEKNFWREISGCEVAGCSVRLFVCTLQRLSHVPEQRGHPGWGCRVLRDPRGLRGNSDFAPDRLELTVQRSTSPSSLGFGVWL